MIGTDIDDVIARLVAIREEHGNVMVFHNDCEWGLSPASPGLSKVLSFAEDGSAPMNWGAEQLDIEKRQIVEFDLAMYEDCWDNHMSEGTRGMWESREAYLKFMQESNDERTRFIERFNEAPFAVVF
jgi:hypothetical protein